MSHNPTKRWRILAALAVLVMILALLPALAAAQPAQTVPTPGPTILSPSSNPYGKTYGQWSVLWWQWAIKPKYSESALTDTNGSRCAIGQSGSVWFLAGVANASGTVVRDCVVPSNVALFMPVLNYEMDEYGVPSPSHPSPYTPLEMRNIAADIILNGTTGLYFTVDNVTLKEADLRATYRTQSSAFTYTMWAADNMYGITCTPGFTPRCKDGSGKTVPFALLTCSSAPNSRCTAIAYGDGYYVMLAPLSPGQHTLHFGGTFKGTPPYILDITYHLTVQ